MGRNTMPLAPTFLSQTSCTLRLWICQRSQQFFWGLDGAALWRLSSAFCYRLFYVINLYTVSGYLHIYISPSAAVCLIIYYLSNWSHIMLQYVDKALSKRGAWIEFHHRMVKYFKNPSSRFISHTNKHTLNLNWNGITAASILFCVQNVQKKAP